MGHSRCCATQHGTADANERRADFPDGGAYAAVARTLIAVARRLYAGDPFGATLERTASALDTITVDLCLSRFARARFPHGEGAAELPTMMDLSGHIPVVVHIYDIDILDVIVPEPGAIWEPHSLDGAGDGHRSGPIAGPAAAFWPCCVRQSDRSPADDRWPTSFGAKPAWCRIVGGSSWPMIRPSPRRSRTPWALNRLAGVIDSHS